MYIYTHKVYLVLHLIRGALVFSSLPLLRRLSADGSPTAAEAVVMTWGGLRGALGLDTILYCTILYCKILYDTRLYYTILY